LSSFAAEARAQGAPPGGGATPTLPSLDKQANEGEKKPAADDLRSGHLYVRAESGLDVPFGQAQSGGTIDEVAPFGLAVGGSIGVGLSRYAEIDATGSYSLMKGDCTTCSASTIAASLGLSYHLVQGASLDPWVRFGVGYRTSDFAYEDTDRSKFKDLPAGRYHGVDIARFTLGATYFPVQGFGFGPYLVAGIGTMVAGPEPLDGRRAYGFFGLGVRIEIDPFSWASTARTTPTPAPATAADGGSRATSRFQAANPWL
jgi:hypothetical protein